MNRQLISHGLLFASLLSCNLWAAEPTQGITITGDKELPQVLYIIPWKEQIPATPDAPVLKNPILLPLSPCDTGQAMDEYQKKLWNCASIKQTRPP